MNTQSILQFASANPWLGFVLILCLTVLAYGVLDALYRVITWPFRLANHWMRHKNLQAVGEWPPPWMDADGDWHEQEYEQECQGCEHCEDDPSEKWKQGN